MRQHHEGVEREDLLSAYDRESGDLNALIADVQREKKEVEAEIRSTADALQKRADLMAH